MIVNSGYEWSFIAQTAMVNRHASAQRLSYAETLSGRAEIFVIVRSLSRNK